VEEGVEDSEAVAVNLRSVPCDKGCRNSGGPFLLLTRTAKSNLFIGYLFIHQWIVLCRRLS
jgi:hypothetical protein